MSGISDFWLRAHAYGFVCFIIFATGVSDVAAFTFGKIFGRHPLRSEISPNKTWEGALGAFAVAMILPWSCDFRSVLWHARIDSDRTDRWNRRTAGPNSPSISVIKREIGPKTWPRPFPATAEFLIGSTV